MIVVIEGMTVKKVMAVKVTAAVEMTKMRRMVV